MKTLYRAAFTLLILATLLPDLPKAAAAEPVTIDFWIFQDFLAGDAGALIKKFVAEFENANPGIKIHLIGKTAPDILSGVVMGAGSGALPDVISTQYAFAGSLVKAGLIKDVSSEWHAMPASWQQQFSPWTVKVLTEGNQILGVPFTAYASILYRNLTVLKKAGIDPAVGIKDWADWLAQSKKIKESGFFASAKYLDFPWAHLNFYGGIKGAQLGLSPDGKSLTMDVSKYADALQFMKEFQSYSSNVSFADQAANDLFTTNKMAFFVSGPFADPTFEQAKKNSGLDYDYILIPGQTADTHGAVYGGEFLAVLKTTKTDSAWKWASFLADAPQMKRFAAGIGRYVSNDVVLADPEIKNNALLQLTSKAFESAVPEVPLMADLPEQFLQPMADNGTLILLGKETPQQAAKNAIDQMNQSLQNR
ncbi:MAG: extracellular solute-binding protein [Verrucomicrobia bacterium]|nr:extracellular solute-binding protein [Verrucomicrobiota bacterium]